MCVHVCVRARVLACMCVLTQASMRVCILCKQACAHMHTHITDVQLWAIINAIFKTKSDCTEQLYYVIPIFCPDQKLQMDKVQFRKNQWITISPPADVHEYDGSVHTWARMHVGRIAPLSADIFYPVDKLKKLVCMSPGYNYPGYLNADKVIRPFSPV